jgi:hypothetical protein
MRYNTDHATKVASNTRFKVLKLVFLFLLLAALPLCSGCLPDSSPPDLRGCTRLEIQYHPSTVGYFLPGSLENLLNAEERKYLESLQVVVNDGERINAFAREVSLGSYNGHLWGEVGYATPVYITCYRGSKRVVSFTVLGSEIVTEDKRWFKYPVDSPNLELIEPPEIHPFKLRGQCARNMQRLYISGSLFGKDVFGRNAKAYPEPNQWCDLIVEGFRNSYSIYENGIKKRSYSEEEISRIFICPSSRERPYVQYSDAEPTEPNSLKQPAPLLESHYAMNPNCRPSSPPDTVLLFEAKPGWNQHGGPELFTFDNHDPHGGCVLLNDGTVKFIRTTEEFQQVRWK